MIRALCCLLVAVVLVSGCGGKDFTPETALELRPLGVDWRPEPARFQGNVRTSQYLAMRDGVRIAVDVYLPDGLAKGERIPAIIRATRYWRRWELWPPFSWFVDMQDFTNLFTSQGYAVVVVDARGSGASFGSRRHPWSPAETGDYREIIGWIAEQPWSDGKVGAQGISYDGTAAEFMAGQGHPALKAACIRFALYDVFADIAYPGGVRNERFLKNWSAFNRSLDAGDTPEVFPFLAELAVRGPAPVDGPDGRELLDQAQAEHLDNVDIYKAATQVEFRDDVSEAAGVPIDAFSPHAMPDAEAPLLVLGGWFDGAYADALLKRFVQSRAPQRAILGAWNHAGTEDTDPFNELEAEPDPSFDAQLLEILRFFDYHLKGRGHQPREELVYKVMGTDLWLASGTWPPEGTTQLRLGLGADGGLGESVDGPGKTELNPNMDFRTGGKRWFTQLSRSDVYIKPKAWEQQGVLAFTGEPLKGDLIIAGSPVISLTMQSSLAGAALHAYLVAVSPDGAHIILSEGLLRTLHRKEDAQSPAQSLGAPRRSYSRADAEPLLPGMPGRVAFGLTSTAVRVPAGHRLKLVLAGAGASQFARCPERGTPEFTFFTGPGKAFVEIPVLNPDAILRPVGNE
jgi:hypothetical protein